MLAQVFLHGSRLAILHVEVLELARGADDVLLLGQFFGSLAERRLLLQVLLEVVFPGLAVEVDEVVELLHVELVVAPELVGLLGGHGLDLLPLRLEGFEVLEVGIGLLGRGDHRLDLLDDLQLLLEVVLLQLLELLKRLLSFLLDDGHLSLEGLLVIIGQNLKLLRVSARLDKRLLLGLTLCEVQLVERCLQVLYLRLVRGGLALGDLAQAVHNLLLGGVNLLGEFFLLRLLRILSRFGCDRCGLFARRRVHLVGLFGLLYFFSSLREGVLLRIHHFTFLFMTWLSARRTNLPLPSLLSGEFGSAYT